MTGNNPKQQICQPSADDPNDEPIDLRDYKPSPDDPLYQRAATILKNWKDPPYRFTLINDKYGAWIKIENHWIEQAIFRLNTPDLVSVGVAFINGALYELDPSADFYRDCDPYWSPVVQADHPELAEVYSAITGKQYPVFKVDGSDTEAWAEFEKLKKEAGFSYVQEVFIEDRPPDYVEKPYFRRWFEGSAVAQPDGNPKVVYHGARTGFLSWPRPDEGRLFGGGAQYHFSELYEEADEEGEGSVISAYLSMQKPADLRSDNWNVDDVPVQEYLENMDHDGLLAALVDAGYDGIIYDGSFPDATVTGTHYVVLRRDQIRSVDNYAAFDPAIRTEDLDYRSPSAANSSSSSVDMDSLKLDNALEDAELSHKRPRVLSR